MSLAESTPWADWDFQLSDGSTVGVEAVDELVFSGSAPRRRPRACRGDRLRSGQGCLAGLQHAPLISGSIDMLGGWFDDVRRGARRSRFVGDLQTLDIRGPSLCAFVQSGSTRVNSAIGKDRAIGGMAVRALGACADKSGFCGLSGRASLRAASRLSPRGLFHW